MPISPADLPSICNLSDALLRLLEDLPRALRALDKAKAKGQFDSQVYSPHGFVADAPRDALEVVRDKLLKALAPSKDEESYRYTEGDSDITDSDLDLRHKVALKALFQLCADAGKWHSATGSLREETILQLLELRQTLDPTGSNQRSQAPVDRTGVPPEPSAPPHEPTNSINPVAELDRLIECFLRGNKDVMRSPVRLVAFPAGNLDARAMLESISPHPAVADVVIPYVEGVTHVELMGFAGVEQNGVIENRFLHAMTGGEYAEAALRLFCGLACSATTTSPH